MSDGSAFEPAADMNICSDLSEARDKAESSSEGGNSDGEASLGSVDLSLALNTIISEGVDDS